MNKAHEPLWPFGTKNALLAAVAIWTALAILLLVSQRYLAWPDSKSTTNIIFVVIALGLLPTVLLLFDFLASRRAVLDIKGVKIDFSGVDFAKTEVGLQTPAIPDNIGISGPIVTDTRPMNIIHTLENATTNEIVVLDLKSGESWWVTRLLALSSGAVRADSPAALVFVGRKGNRDQQWLGWATPRDVLQSILAAEPKYKERYIKASRIAKQVIMYGANEFVPLPPHTLNLHYDVQRYVGSQDYTNLGEAVTEQILMDQLAKQDPPNSLEDPPDRLTLGRLTDLFGHCLRTESIDLNASNEEQVSKLLESEGFYIALVRAGRYQSMIRRSDGERLLLREMFRASKDKEKA